MYVLKVQFVNESCKSVSAALIDIRIIYGRYTSIIIKFSFRVNTNYSFIITYFSLQDSFNPVENWVSVSSDIRDKLLWLRIIPSFTGVDF